MDIWEPEGVGSSKVEPDPPRSGSALALMARRISQAALDFLYPPACLVCQARTANGDGLCPSCWGRISFIERPLCERTGVPFERDLGVGVVSPQAAAEPPVYERARAVARYDEGPVRQLVYRLKYGDRTDLARPLGRWMARAGAELVAEADLLVPVPLHRLRLAARRFNQAAILASVVAREGGARVDPFALDRVKATPPQVGLTKAQRAANVQGAFRVPDPARIRVTGRRVLLVDDVLTSGSTTNAAARALLRGGAAAVDVLVFARVVTGG